MTDIAQIGISIDTKDVKVAQGELDKLSREADDAGEALEDLERDAKKTGDAIDKKLTQPVKRGRNSVANYEKSTKKAGKSTGKFGQLAGQAGFQVGDFAVQVQGGQSALLAFSQQGSQLLGAFGAGGAIAGAILAVGAAIGGIFLRSTKDANDAIKEFISNIDELEEKAEQLKLSDAEIALASGTVFDQLEAETKQLKERKKEAQKLNGILIQQEKILRDVVKSGFDRRTADADILRTTKELEKANALVAISEKKIIELKRQRKLFQSDAIEQTEENLDRQKRLNEVLRDGVSPWKTFAQNVAAAAQEMKELEKSQAKAAKEQARLVGIDESFVSGIIQSSLTPIEIAEKRLNELNAIRERGFEDQNKLAQAELILTNQIEEMKTQKIIEENLKRKQMVAGYFQDASDIMSTFNDFMSLSSIGRKQTLEDELRNNKSLSAEQVKNKEAELRGIFNQEKNAKKNSILMSTAAGVMTQLATGNFVAAAKVGAAGAVNYAKVNATSFKSPAPAPSSPVSSSPQQTTSNITFDFSNIPSGAMISPDGLVDMMKQSLRDAKLNGEVI